MSYLPTQTEVSDGGAQIMHLFMSFFRQSALTGILLHSQPWGCAND